MKRKICYPLLLFFCWHLKGSAQILVGDMNRDGQINVSDVTSLVSVILGNSEKTYITAADFGIGDDYESVDLSLPSGTLWATCNVGATTPEGHGNLFAWGETTSKTNYLWNTYFDTTDGGTSFTTYNIDGGLTQLQPLHDAASTLWGSSWCTPTKAQWDELMSECTWVSTTENSVTGYKVTGPNNNTLFLPAAGYSIGANTYDNGYGCYWSSTLGTSTSAKTYILEFKTSYTVKEDNRYYGNSVRPVRVSDGVKVTGITLNQTSLSLESGSTQQLAATVSPSNAANKSVLWSSSNPSVATISSTGLVTCIGAGTATITCSAADGSGVTATCSVTVTEATVLISSITLNTTNVELSVGDTHQLTVTILPSNATNTYVTCSSNDPSVATVSSSGLITAVAAGTATITCSATDGSGVTATCAVTVSVVPVSSIKLSYGLIDVYPDDSTQVTATVSPTNATNKAVTWSSSDTSVATVSSTGYVTTVGVGSATITCSATDGSGVTASCAVKVSPRLITSMTLNKYSLSLKGYYRAAHSYNKSIQCHKPDSYVEQQ